MNSENIKRKLLESFMEFYTSANLIQDKDSCMMDAYIAGFIAGAKHVISQTGTTVNIGLNP